MGAIVVNDFIAKASFMKNLTTLFSPHPKQDGGMYVSSIKLK